MVARHVTSWQVKYNCQQTTIHRGVFVIYSNTVIIIVRMKLSQAPHIYQAKLYYDKYMTGRLGTLTSQSTRFVVTSIIGNAGSIRFLGCITSFSNLLNFVFYMIFRPYHAVGLRQHTINTCDDPDD